MQQMSLISDPPRARRTDPATSHKAAAEAKAVQANHHGNIIAVLSRFGPQGVDGIAARCGLTGHQVGKRMVELERLGSVAQTGKVVMSTSGRSQREWRIA
jgi:predicted ArsR family transcriptional regulator